MNKEKTDIIWETSKNSYFIPTEHFPLRLQGHLWFREFTEVGRQSLQLPGSSLLQPAPSWCLVKQTISTFKMRLKTFLFDKANSYGWFRSPEPSLLAQDAPKWRVNDLLGSFVRFLSFMNWHYINIESEFYYIELEYNWMNLTFTGQYWTYGDERFWDDIS